MSFLPCSHFCQKTIKASVNKTLNRPVSNVVLLLNWSQLLKLNSTSVRATVVSTSRFYRAKLNSYIIRYIRINFKSSLSRFFLHVLLVFFNSYFIRLSRFDTTETSQLNKAVARRLKQALPNIVACSPLSRSHTTLETGSVLSYWRKEWDHLEKLVLGSVQTVRLGRLNCGASSWLTLVNSFI